jgi:hypothetical protein
LEIFYFFSLAHIYFALICLIRSFLLHVAIHLLLPFEENKFDCTAKVLSRKFETKFPEMKLRGHVPDFYIHVSVSYLFIPTIGPSILPIAFAVHAVYAVLKRNRGGSKTNSIKGKAKQKNIVK